jgi:signal transduction histidine kinase
LDRTIPTLASSQKLSAQHDNKRLEDGIRAFKILSWTGGAFGLSVFLFAYLSGTPLTTGFVLVIGFVAGFLALPFALEITNKIDLIVVTSTIWMVLCIGVAAWHFGGYAAAALPWLCAIPIFAYYYLRGAKLAAVLIAMGGCFAFVTYQHLSGNTDPGMMTTKNASIAYGASFALLLVYLSIVSYLFRSAEDNAQNATSAALEDAKQAQLKAEEANAAKSQFLASMSHELRTPLNALVGFSDFMRQKTPSSVSSAKFQEYSEDMHSSATHLLGIVEDILHYAEMGAAKTEVTTTNVDLRRVVNSALKVIAYQSGASDLVITQHISEKLPLLSGDERFLNQIVINLLANAVKFTENEGRVAVDVYVDDTERVVLRVSDTGIGISADDLPKLTQPFFKTTNARRVAGQGLGLGLAITSELVEIHDGTLSIESEIGVGTTITCTFPASRTVTRPEDDDN